MEVRSYMRTNGFIFIALVFAVATWAGTPGYLPSVGPIGLQFAPPFKPGTAVPLPVLPPAPEPVAEQPTPEGTAENPVPPPTTPGPEPSSPASEPGIPIVVLQAQSGAPTNNPAGPLIGPMMETNNAVTPQMFLRFFSPNRKGPSQEAIIAVPPGFNPAQPPSASSTVNYSQPKP